MISQKINNPLFEKVFSTYNTRLLKKHFHSIYLTKASQKQQGLAIYLINHSSWWDSLILFHLNQTVLHTKAIAMMSQDGLSKFPFFQKLGAFPVDRSSLRSIAVALNYAKEQLESGSSLFLFPQGDEFPLEKRPFRFFSGAAYIHEKLPHIPVVPILFYHSLLHHQLPEWFIHIGKPLELQPSANRKEKTLGLEGEMEMELNHLRNLVLEEKFENFNVLLKGKEGVM
ncbi:MAG: lysophospholipid acyltransferase family protein [Bacillus sp. (in: Bacteria)]|nr:lysophospholipid acyltransferase family protein [Bacillus sp. (in: firmicutes)]